jgi:4-hydroxybenzoyl-CoA thioesterase
MVGVYVHRVRVAWGDCDPAGILFTPRVFDYCTEALECFYRDVLDADWPNLVRQRHMGSPMVHVECDFLAPMPPDLELAVELGIDKLGTASLTYVFTGRAPDGSEHFRARFVACITDFQAGRPVPIPAAMRARAEAFMNDG